MNGHRRLPKTDYGSFTYPCRASRGGTSRTRSWLHATVGRGLSHRACAEAASCRPRITTHLLPGPDLRKLPRTHRRRTIRARESGHVRLIGSAVLDGRSRAGARDDLPAVVRGRPRGPLEPATGFPHDGGGPGADASLADRDVGDGGHRVGNRDHRHLDRVPLVPGGTRGARGRRLRRLCRCGAADRDLLPPRLPQIERVR